MTHPLDTYVKQAAIEVKAHGVGWATEHDLAWLIERVDEAQKASEMYEDEARAADLARQDAECDLVVAQEREKALRAAAFAVVEKVDWTYWPVLEEKQDVRAVLETLRSLLTEEVGL